MGLSRMANKKELNYPMRSTKYSTVNIKREAIRAPGEARSFS